MRHAINHLSVQRGLKYTSAIGLAATTVLGLLTPATAQESAQTAQAVTGIEEIIVTARRREENIQQVPISITAFTADDLRRMNITTSRQLGELTPSYVEDSVYGRDRGGFERLRSIPGVRAYFAEAPVGSSAGAGGYYDLENVQVLVGPQGTLFGINAVGGAILREPVRPGNKLGGYALVGTGSYNQILLGGAINMPFIPDKAMARVAVQREKRNGFTRIQSNDLDVDDVNYTAYRIGLTLKPFEGFENYTVYDTRSSNTHGPSRFL